MTSPLHYYCYFLFRTYRLLEGRKIEEPSALLKDPATFSDKVVHFKISTDKRLFCFAQEAGTLDDALLHTWHRLTRIYQTTSDTLLLGVSVVISGTKETLQQPITVYLGEKPVTFLDLSGSQSSVPLLNIQLLNKTPVATFCELKLKGDHKLSEWQLATTQGNAKITLEPLQCEESQNHPMLAVYALEQHSGYDEAVNEFLFDKVKNEVKDSAFNRLMPMLITHQWQFSHINYAARHFRDELQRKNSLYRSHIDAVLKCCRTGKLETHLQEMARLQAEGKYVIGRIFQAIETLEINQGNLKRRLHSVEENANHRWSIDWQQKHESEDASAGDLPEPALLKACSRDIKQLRRKEAYIQGMLTYLEGSRLRWQAFLEERRTKLSERLGAVGHSIILLVALAEMGHALEKLSGQHHEWKPEWLQNLDNSAVIHGLTKMLESPSIYIGLIVLFTLPVILILLKRLKEFCCCLSWIQNICRKLSWRRKHE